MRSVRYQPRQRQPLENTHKQLLQSRTYRASSSPSRPPTIYNQVERMTFTRQRRVTIHQCLLLFMLLTAVAAQDAAVTTVEPALAAASGPIAGPSAADLAVSPSVVGSTVRARNVRVQQQSFPERHPMVTERPNFRGMSLPELQAAYSGALAPSAVPSSDAITSSSGPIDPQANGIAGASYADSRFGTGTDYAAVAKTQIGRLLARFGGTWYQCTASVINKALLVTAAHCVFSFGKTTTGWPDIVSGQYQVSFEPGLDGSTAALGKWWAKGFMVPTPYYDGTDTFLAGSPGVIVNNDVALVWLLPNSASKQIGDVTGYMGYGWNAYSFSAPVASWAFPTAPATAQLTQFGYPVGFDSGNRMQISNAATYVMSTSNVDLKNIIRGSSMTGGSSGGPWIANYGVNAAGADYGSNNLRNVVVGVTSWGFTDATAKAQGASFFGTNKQFSTAYGTRGSGNIAKLMYDACDNTASGSWMLKSKGLCV